MIECMVVYIKVGDSKSFKKDEYSFDGFYDWAQWFLKYKKYKNCRWIVEGAGERFETRKRISVEKFVLSDIMNLIGNKNKFFTIKIIENA